jgi:NAD(P)-dependent dehydrogenase (short-subunit alcohol dehydrogenase family)
MAGRLEGKTALVTGGASGMGRAGAVAFAREGAAVMLADINLARAEELAAGIVAEGGRASAVAFDVTDSASVEAMTAATVAELGRIDVLYHCAVDARFVNYEDKRLTELEDAVWERMIRICLTGAFYVCKHVGRQMLAQGSGSIILSGTTDALIGCAGLDSYTAAKGGVTALVRSLAAGLAPDGIRVNAIAPSFVSTEPQKVWLEDDAARTTIEQLHLLPIPTPEEIAPLVVFLASEESRRMTGTVIPLDSGYMAFKAQLDVMGAMQANADG